MSQELLNELMSKSEALNSGEKLKLMRYLSSHLASLSEQNQSVITRSRLKVIESKKFDILQVSADYGASNIRYIIEDKEVIFIVDLAKNKSLFELGGLLESLRELLGFEVVVFTESMLKKQYRESIINQVTEL